MDNNKLHATNKKAGNDIEQTHEQNHEKNNINYYVIHMRSVSDCCRAFLFG